MGFVFLFLFHGHSWGDAPSEGKKIYMQQCASCHGNRGQGTKAYSRPLIGRRSLAHLTRYINNSMPEDDPDACRGKDAEQVAKYIYDAFYSPAAQSRNKATRIALARLTVSEYRNAVTDLVGSFTHKTARESTQKPSGLRGQYFITSGRNRRKLVINRIDPVIDLDLGQGSKDFPKIQTGNFSANWQGSFQTLDTGLYEFLVRTEHSMQLWVNDLNTPLIDAKVKSGKDTEFRGAVFLLGGRKYPIRLTMSRKTLGVRKKAKEKPKPVKTTISLEWKPPFRAYEVIPTRQLFPDTTSKVYVLGTALPPDDRSAGYERGNAISKEWVQATTEGAVKTANYVVAHLSKLSGVGPKTPDRQKRLRMFCQQFVERAFRQPLSPEQKKLYVDRQFTVAKNPETAVKRVVLLTLLSPQFLYREPGSENDPYDVAARLSFGLWDSLPDEELIAAARSGKLKSREDVRRQAFRMLDDPRAKAKLHHFFLQWLQVDQVQTADLAKEDKHFRDFDKRVISDLRTSLELFLHNTLWSETADFRQLLQADYLYLNGRLSQVYGGGLAKDAPFQKVTLKAEKRRGVLTHPYLLAHFSHDHSSSPIHRGVFLARNVLGVALRPPPDAFAPLAPELHPKLNTRERVALQTSPKNCMSCHKVINNLGFTLEHFGAIGDFRKVEKGRPIDATGSYVKRSGDTVKFNNQQDLATFLKGSDEVAESFASRLFHYLVRQPMVAFGSEKLNEFRQFFVEHDYNIRSLVVEIMVETALRPNETKTAGETSRPQKRSDS